MFFPHFSMISWFFPSNLHVFPLELMCFDLLFGREVYLKAIQNAKGRLDYVVLHPRHARDESKVPSRPLGPRETSRFQASFADFPCISSGFMRLFEPFPCVFMHFEPFSRRSGLGGSTSGAPKSLPATAWPLLGMATSSTGGMPCACCATRAATGCLGGVFGPFFDRFSVEFHGFSWIFIDFARVFSCFA